MKQLIKILVFSFLMGTLPATAEDRDFDAIRIFLQKYFEGTEQGKPDLLTGVFLPSLELQYVKEDGTNCTRVILFLVRNQFDV